MKNRAIARQAIHAVFNTLSTADIERLAHASKAIETAGKHYGLNSQVAANGNFDSITNDVLERMPAYYVRELADKLPTQVCNVSHDRALIAFGSDVLTILQYGPNDDKMRCNHITQIRESAHEFGLAHCKPADLVGNFIYIPRADFKNPLNL